MASIIQLQKAIRSAGGTADDAYILAGVSYCLTGGDTSWSSGDGRGAWGVSQKWYPGTPADLAGQARQAFNIYKSRGLVGFSEKVAAVAVRWWYPSGDAPEDFSISMQNRAETYKEKARSKFQVAGFEWAWIVVAGVAIWYFFGRKK